MLKYFIFTNITEMFFTNFLISFLISFFLSLQFFLLQIWFFLSKGLFKHENLKLIKFYSLYIFFHLIIILIIFIQIIPNIWFIFIQITFTNKYLFNIYFEPQLNNYFNFLFSSFIYIYILFIYYFCIILLFIYQIFKIQTIINLRKFFYLKFIIMATILSPPDILSQLLLFFFFFFFFEFLIFISFFFNKYFNKIE